MTDDPDEKTPGDDWNSPVPAENADPAGEEDAVDQEVLKEIEKD